MDPVEMCLIIPPTSPNETAAIIGALIVGGLYLYGWVSRDPRGDQYGSAAAKTIQTILFGPKKGVPVLDKLVPFALTLGLNKALPWIGRFIRRLGGIRG